MGDSYRFLRTVEHRLQMIDDQQTHTLPKTSDGLDHIARFTGFADTREFEEMLRAKLVTVQSHYARLFEREAPLASRTGSLVFTGVEEDPETLATLERMGFERTADISAIIRGWHHGRIRATRSARARELLTKLMPALLEALAKTADPLSAFTHFDRFLSGLPSGVQVFSMLLANPKLLDLIAEIAGSAPKLADYLGRHAGVLDALIDPGFLTEIPSRAELESHFAAELARVSGYEAALDAARRFAKEETFRIGVQIIQGMGDVVKAGPAYAAVAETVIAGLQGTVENEMVALHGRVPGGAFAVVAQGKLGGREMTAASDLDLVFVYTHASDAVQSEGARPLSPPVYFARLAQRFISALTAMTAEGRLYEVDMRLRPSGNQGPVAVRFDTFLDYHRERSWTWERMALTRARVLSGPVALSRDVEVAIRASLMRACDAEAIFEDARAMREKLAAQFPGSDIWDINDSRPADWWISNSSPKPCSLARQTENPGALDQNTLRALEKLMQSGALDIADAQDADLGRMAGARLDSGSFASRWRASVQARSGDKGGSKPCFARAGDAPDFTNLQANLAENQRRVREIFTRLMGLSPQTA